MSYWQLIGVLLAVLLTGLIKLFRLIKELQDEYVFINDFREKFIALTNKFTEDNHVDQNLYHWLTSKSIKAQRVLGPLGRGYYIAAFYRYTVPDYEYIINTLPQMRTGHADQQDILYCDDMLTRYLGQSKEVIEKERKKLFSPVSWFQNGIQFYVGLPIRLLYWFGIIGLSTFNKATANQFFRAISGLIALATFLASLVTIILGWEKSIEILQKLTQ